MKSILKISSAFIGAVLGAGFASGQEIMQYFTSFGQIGILGAIAVAILFGITGMLLVSIGYKLKAISHMEVIRQISGRYLGMGYDIVIIFVLFGIGLVMLAGAGPIFSQQFEIPTYMGTILMSVLVLITIMTGVKKVIQVLAVVTPVFLLVIVFVNIYSLITSDNSTAEMESIALQQASVTNNWFTAAFNYLSVVTLTNAAMLFIMGGSETNGKHAAAGGFLGGLLCGVLVLVSNMAIFQNIDVVASLQMPTLGLATQISPLLGLIFSVALFGMIYGTGVSMFFSFSSRFFEPKTKGFNIFSIITIIVASSLSLYGFSELISIVFPIVGYLGYIFLVILVVGAFRLRSKAKTEEIPERENLKAVK
ncbi:YkvI family membrane protein [Oceanobacillus locisalsi]|uniref:Membrane protein YkvI n=1 Tax=Oceanobacillus locisalsi TaxID=546107 RepID=A0ABW3NHN6_9BACI